MGDFNERDRLGLFIGDTRVNKELALEKLAEGICTPSYLNQLENGEREMGKLLTDTLLQRLGLFSERFNQILNLEEFEKWHQRLKVGGFLNKGDTESAGKVIDAYKCCGRIDKQFVGAARVNVSWLNGAPVDELLPMVEEALKCTRPHFKRDKLGKAVFSELEGCLLFSWLRLREQLEGLESVSEEYLTLLKRLGSNFYDERERAYLTPYLACHVAEWYFECGNFDGVLDVCRSARHDLAVVKRIGVCRELLLWEQKAIDRLGLDDDMPGKLAHQLELMRPADMPRVNLLVLYEERGMAFSINQVIKTRRIAFGLSQQELAEGICDVRTLSRIENMRNSPQKRTRRALLQKLGMSGERYDYQIITKKYEDYVRCIDYEGFSNNGENEKADNLFEILKNRTPDTVTNRQYITAQETYRQGELKNISVHEEIKIIKKALAMTLPLDVENVGDWKVCSLSINEIYIILNLAEKYAKQKQYTIALPLLRYVLSSFKLNGDNMNPYVDTYIRFVTRIASYAGDIGEYEESDRLAKQCIEWSLECNNARMLAVCLEGMAWNIEHVVDDIPISEFEKRKECMRQVHSLYRQAYAVAIVSESLSSKRFIEEHYRKIYRLENVF